MTPRGADMSIEAKLADLQGRMGTLEAAVGKMEGRVAGVEASVVKVESAVKVSDSERAQQHSQNRASIHDLRNTLQVYTDKTHIIQEDITGMRVQLEVLAGTPQGKIGLLDQFKTDVKEDFAEVKSHMKAEMLGMKDDIRKLMWRVALIVGGVSAVGSVLGFIDLLMRILSDHK
jgi:predicted  nucleic acid-binding Zn-ribbon protein